MCKEPTLRASVISVKPHSTRTGTRIVFAVFGCSRASQSKRRRGLCDMSLVWARYRTVCKAISLYCVLAYPLWQCGIYLVLVVVIYRDWDGDVADWRCGRPQSRAVAPDPRLHRQSDRPDWNPEARTRTKTAAVTDRRGGYRCDARLDVCRRHTTETVPARRPDISPRGAAGPYHTTAYTARTPTNRQRHSEQWRSREEREPQLYSKGTGNAVFPVSDLRNIRTWVTAIQ